MEGFLFNRSLEMEEGPAGVRTYDLLTGGESLLCIRVGEVGHQAEHDWVSSTVHSGLVHRLDVRTREERNLRT